MTSEEVGGADFSEEYARARTRLSVAVREAVAAVSPTIQMSGSFRHGDFHLDARTLDSLSDVDLIVPEAEGLATRAQIHSAVLAAVTAAGTSPIPVSMRPADSFTRLTAADARFLALGEYLRKSQRSPQADSRSFLIAKITLMVMRNDQTERYVDTAIRLGTAEARSAARTKLGLQTNFEPHEAAIAVAGGPPEARRFGKQCLVGAISDDTYFQYLSDLEARVHLASWLREVLRHEILEALELSRAT